MDASVTYIEKVDIVISTDQDATTIATAVMDRLRSESGGTTIIHLVQVVVASRPAPSPSEIPPPP